MKTSSIKLEKAVLNGRNVTMYINDGTIIEGEVFFAKSEIISDTLTKERWLIYDPENKEVYTISVNYRHKKGEEYKSKVLYQERCEE